MAQQDSEALARQIELRTATAGLDEIYESIGNALPPEERDEVVRAAGLKVPTPAQIGKAYHDRVLPKVKDAICRQANYCRNRGKYDSATKIASLVAGAVGQAIGGPLGSLAGLVVELSAAILKIGLNDLCGCPG